MTALTKATTALLIIDMQRDFCSPGGYASQAGLDTGRLSGVIRQIDLLLQTARASGITVLHTREGHVPDLSDCPPEKLRRSREAGAEIGSMGPLGRLLIRGEVGHDIIEELAPLPTEQVIDKPGYGAFYSTSLETLLQAAGITTLILCGVTTEVCVHSTLREAVDRGYRCITAADSCAASNPSLQQPAMAMIAVEGGIFGSVMPATKIAILMREAA